MTNAIQKAVHTIPVPAGLSDRVLSVCEQPIAPKKPARMVQLIPAAVAAAACAAVVLTVLLSGGGQTPPPTGPLSAEPGTTVPDGDAIATGSNTTSTTSATPMTTGDATDSTAPNGTTQTSHRGADTATDGKATQTTWKGTASTANHAACQLVIPGRFEVMTEKELEAHYGRRYLPTRLPADMVQPEIYEERGVYYKDEAVIAELPTNWEFLLEQGTIRDAAVIYDRNTYYWHSAEDASRNLSVSVSTAPYPGNRLGDLSRFDETMTVAGVEVKLHHYDDAPYSDTWCYSALAEVDGVAFYVSAWEFTREEFLDTLASLLE